MTARTGRKWRWAGTNGAGGAGMSIEIVVRPSGADAATGTRPRRTSRVGSKNSMPADDRVDRVQPELEAGHDAEVAAAAANRPEQVGMLGLAGGQQAAVRGDDVDRHEGIDGHPVLAHEPADAATQGQAGDADARGVAERRRQAVGRRGTRVLAGGQAGLRPGQLAIGIDVQAAHAAQVEDDAAVDGAEAGQAVRSTANRQVEPGVAGEQDGAGHVARRWPPGRSSPGIGRYARVLDLAGHVVGLVTGDDDGAGDAGREGGDVGDAGPVDGGEVRECHAVVFLSGVVRWGALAGYSPRTHSDGTGARPRS